MIRWNMVIKTAAKLGGNHFDSCSTYPEFDHFRRSAANFFHYSTLFCAAGLIIISMIPRLQQRQADWCVVTRPGDRRRGLGGGV